MNNNRVGYLKHDGVMISVNEIVSNSPAGIFVDATYGYGSHFNYLKQKNGHLEIIGIDRVEAVKNSSDEVLNIKFSNITDVLSIKNILDISGVSITLVFPHIKLITQKEDFHI